MRFVGGFIGTAIDKREEDGTMVVRPAIGWMTFYVEDKKRLMTVAADQTHEFSHTKRKKINDA